MLVLTRKSDEQIMIGDDIKITLVRVRGNSVRIGIDAPKHVRIVRGELESSVAADKSASPNPAVNPLAVAQAKAPGAKLERPNTDAVQFAQRTPSIAHSQGETDSSSTSRLPELARETESMPAAATARSIYVGRLPCPDRGNRVSAAPLARFMAPR